MLGSGTTRRDYSRNQSAQSDCCVTCTFKQTTAAAQTDVDSEHPYDKSDKVFGSCQLETPHGSSLEVPTVEGAMILAALVIFEPQSLPKKANSKPPILITQIDHSVML